MSKDIVFECSHCHQWLEAPPDMASLFVECPKCNAVIKVPSSGSGSVSTGLPRREFKAEPPAENPDADDQLKSSTIRINLPPNLGIPAAPKRRLTIRRNN